MDITYKQEAIIGLLMMLKENEDEIKDDYTSRFSEKMREHNRYINVAITALKEDVDNYMLSYTE